MPPRGTGPYLYKLLGTWGFVALADSWSCFRRWHHRWRDAGSAPPPVKHAGRLIVTEGWAKQKREGQTLVGFALETHDGEANARGKLERKNLDWVVLNVQGEAGSGFGTGTNRVTLIGRDGQRIDVATAPKPEIARAILDAIA